MRAGTDFSYLAECCGSLVMVYDLASQRSEKQRTRNKKEGRPRHRLKTHLLDCGTSTGW